MRALSMQDPLAVMATMGGMRTFAARCEENQLLLIWTSKLAMAGDIVKFFKVAFKEGIEFCQHR